MSALPRVSSEMQSQPDTSHSPIKTARPGNSERILFFVPFGEWEVHNQVDAALAAALRLRGADVRLVRCDGIYPACDVLAWAGERSKEQCQQCAAHSSELFASRDLPVMQMRAHLAPEDFAAIRQWAQSVPVSSYSTAEWNGIPIGKWVKSSVFSYFCITQAGLERPEVQEVHRRFLETGALTWLALSRMIDEYQPTRCVIFNGRMAPFRVAQELAAQRGIPFLCHERGQVDDSFIFYENQDCLSTRPLHQSVDRWKDIPLTREECQSAKEYLDSRERGKGMNFPSFYSYRTEYMTARRALRIPPDAKVLLALTSSEFELASSEHHLDTTKQMQVIDRLIEVFRSRPEYLVVRHHPNIAGGKTFPPDYAFLTRACRQAESAPANVRIILPSESLSSYALFWNIDACIAFFTTAGVEAVARGVATASFRDAFYQQSMSRGIEDTSFDGMKALVNDLFRQTEVFDLVDLRRVYRFLHAFTRKLAKRFTSFGIKNHFERDLRFNALGELAPGRDQELDIVCDHLLTGSSLWHVPSAEDKGRDAGEENEFLKEHLAKLQEHRAAVHRQSAHFLEWRLTPTVAIVRMIWTGEKPLPDFVAWTGRPFRHRQTQKYDCQIAAGVPHPVMIQAIAASLATVREDYVLVTSDSFWHDESAVSSAVDLLLDDAKLAVDGVLFAAWLVSAESGINSEIFTERAPADSYEEAVAQLPLLREAHFFLPFGVFRKEKLLALLEEISHLPDSEIAARRLFEALRRGSYHTKRVPMLALTPPKVVAAPLC